MSPHDHAKLSVRDFGGNTEDYIEIHKFLDSTKFHIPDSRHRIILHNSFGMYLCERIFGDVIIVNNKSIPVREIARKHILQDCQTVPTLKESLISYGDDTYMQKYNNPNKNDLKWIKEN